MFRATALRSFLHPLLFFPSTKMRINETKELRADIKVNRYVAVQRSSSVAMQRGCVMCGRISRSQPGKVRCRCAGLAPVCNCNCSLRSVSRCPHCSQSSDQQQLNAKNIYLQMILSLSIIIDREKVTKSAISLTAKCLIFCGCGCEWPWPAAELLS